MKEYWFFKIEKCTEHAAFVDRKAEEAIMDFISTCSVAQAIHSKTSYDYGDSYGWAFDNLTHEQVDDLAAKGQTDFIFERCGKFENWTVQKMSQEDCETWNKENKEDRELKELRLKKKEALKDVLMLLQQFMEGTLPTEDLVDEIDHFKKHFGDMENSVDQIFGAT